MLQGWSGCGEGGNVVSRVEVGFAHYAGIDRDCVLGSQWRSSVENLPRTVNDWHTRLVSHPPADIYYPY